MCFDPKSKQKSAHVLHSFSNNPGHFSFKLADKETEDFPVLYADDTPSQSVLTPIPPSGHINSLENTKKIYAKAGTGGAEDMEAGHEWVWEAAAGPGSDDPFHNDWKMWHPRFVC